MSVINKKPFIEEVLEKLTQENLETLVGLMNGGEGNVTFKSFINNLYSMSTSDKGIKRMILETKDKIFTGYLIYNNFHCVLICYTNEYAQKMFVVDLDYENKKYTIVDEQISIDEFRRLVEGRTTNLIVEVNDVKANPTLAGSEENLSSIEIDDTKFKVSVVKANPTLEGDEGALNGIEIDGVKYGVGGGSSLEHLYNHTIVIHNINTNNRFFISIISNTSTPINNILSLPLNLYFTVKLADNYKNGYYLYTTVIDTNKQGDYCFFNKYITITNNAIDYYEETELVSNFNISSDIVTALF